MARLSGWRRIWNVYLPDYERACRAGWEEYENVCRGSVDAAGERLTLG